MRAVFAKFFADRGTHLAAMIAYFALLSFVPLLFLTLALLGFAHRPDESSVLVTELSKLFPRTSINTIVRFVTEIQNNAAALGIVGAVFVFWTSLSLFSVLESAFNIVYGRPNRSFLHGKAIALGLLGASLVTLFVGLIVGSFGYEILKRAAPGVASNEHRRLRALDPALGAGRLRLPGRRVQAAHERAAPDAGCPPGRAGRHGRARDELPGAARVPARVEGRDRSAGARRGLRCCSSGST